MSDDANIAFQLVPPVTKCRSCGADIIWAITERGKRIPLNAEPDNAKGNMVIEPWGSGSMDPGNTGRVVVREWRARAVAPLLDASQTRYMPHHATCPQGRQWRR